MAVEVVPRLRGSAVASWLQEAIGRLARDPGTLDGLLIAVGDAVVHESTKTTSRVHFVARDGNGRPRVDALASRLAESALDY